LIKQIDIILLVSSTITFYFVVFVLEGDFKMRSSFGGTWTEEKWPFIVSGG
jgi:hypothetical protein